MRSHSTGGRHLSEDDRLPLRAEEMGLDVGFSFVPFGHDEDPGYDVQNDVGTSSREASRWKVEERTIAFVFTDLTGRAIRFAVEGSTSRKRGLYLAKYRRLNMLWQSITTTPQVPRRTTVRSPVPEHQY